MTERIAKWVAFASRNIASYWARRLEPLGIGPGQFMYLLALYREDGQTQQSLSDAIHVDKSATVGAINKLEAAGYVERRSVETDRRCYQIYLTPAGWALRPQLEAIADEIQAQLTQGMSDEERETLTHLMVRLTENIRHAEKVHAGEQT